MALNDLPEFAKAVCDMFNKTVDACVIEKLDLGKLDLTAFNHVKFTGEEKAAPLSNDDMARGGGKDSFIA
jgi:hypothetical protein